MSYGGGPGQYGYSGTYGQQDYYQQIAQPSTNQQQPQYPPAPNHLNRLPQPENVQYPQHLQYQNQNAYYQQDQQQQQQTYSPSNFANPQQNYYQNPLPQPQHHYSQYPNYQQHQHTSQPQPQLHQQQQQPQHQPQHQQQHQQQQQRLLHQPLSQLHQHQPLSALQHASPPQFYSPQPQPIHIPPLQTQPSPRLQLPSTPITNPSPSMHISPLPTLTSIQTETPIPPPVRRASSLSKQAAASNASPVQTHKSTPKQSPYVSHKQPKIPEQIVDSKLLMALAEEFFSEAHKMSSALAQSMNEEALDTYQRLIATGLGCLETCLLNLELRPRLQARIRLRFAAVMFEETENTTEAEFALTKGISLCEQHKFVDLKYSMQFLLAKILFKSKPKAGLKVLDSTIEDAEAYRHTAWVYALRFLRATLSLKVGTGNAIHAAVQNLRSISTLASEKSDRAIFSTAGLMEVIAHLSAPGLDSPEHANRALASARAYQLDEGSKVPQITFLIHSLDVICSFLSGQPGEGATKLRSLQLFMDSSKDDVAWGGGGAVSVPIEISSDLTQIVSQDTRAVLSVADDGRSLLMLSFITLKDAMALTNLLSGLVLLLKDSVEPHKASQYLRQTHIYLTDSKKVRKRGSPLHVMLDTTNWRLTIATYAHIHQAYCLVIRTEWSEAWQHLEEVKKAIPLIGNQEAPLAEFFIYLTGVYYQGTSKLDQALHAFKNADLSLRMGDRASLKPADRVRQDLSILALLNSIWISQETARQDPSRVTAELAAVEPLCVMHPDPEMRTAFDLINATVLTNPPSSAIKQKNFIKTALNRANTTGNAHFLSMIFSIMCSKFFHGVVGEQAMKSSTTAVFYARKSGSSLWQSVAEGLHAQGLETHGRVVEAQEVSDRANSLAAATFGNKS